MMKAFKNIVRIAFLRCLGYFLRFCYWFRYRIKIVGLENLTKETLNKPGGILFLPNHVAVMIDPTMIICFSWVKFRLRPMVVEYMYKTPGFGLVLKALQSVPVPNFDSGSNSFKKKKLTEAFNELLTDLRKGDNFIIYPAARTKSSAREVIRSSGISYILKNAPETNVVLVRIAGLWGSSFSRAITGKQPDPIHVIKSHLKYIFENLLFFTPRREVVITFVPQPADFPWDANQTSLNAYLEDWYNQPDGLTEQKGDKPGDSLILISYSRWRSVFPTIAQPDKNKNVEIDLRQVPDVIKEAVLVRLAALSGWKKEEIDPKMDLFEDLGLDSLDAAEIIAFLQDEFHLAYVPFHRLTTVGMIMGIAALHPLALERKPDVVPPRYALWEKELTRPNPGLAEGETIPEVFFNLCRHMDSAVACGDNISGVLTYKQMKQRVLLLTEEVKKLPGNIVGIMLPAGPMSFVLAMAVQLAGKVPMMVNWTIGPAHIASTLELSKAEVVLTSWRFVDRLDNVSFDGLDSRFVFYEDLYKNLWPSDKWLVRFREQLSTKQLMKKVGGYALNGDTNAVLVFTSGTEGNPKGVLLSHKNILSNMDALLKVFPLNAKDVIIDILPPFHAFGFTLSGLMGLLSGVRVAFAPNLSDGYQMGADIKAWKATILFSIPTFLVVLFRSATPEQLTTLRLCITGMEKASPYLLGLMAQAGKLYTLAEGYGLSEATATLTINRFDLPHKGDGLPLPGVEIKIVHPETYAPLPDGELGIVIALGPSIFAGYLNPDLPKPFIELNGEQWFVTGDLGYLNHQGFLTVTDRVRRHLRIGGAIVSMDAMEKVLFKYVIEKGWKTGDEAPTIAVVSEEKYGEKPKIHLFTRFSLTPIEVNEVLKEAGFSNIVKVVSVTQLKEIPQLGTGMVNYPYLQELLESRTGGKKKQTKLDRWLE